MGMRLGFSCSATLVGKSIIVLGGTGTRAWSLKEVRLASFYKSNVRLMQTIDHPRRHQTINRNDQTVMKYEPVTFLY